MSMFQKIEAQSVYLLVESLLLVGLYLLFITIFTGRVFRCHKILCNNFNLIVIKTKHTSYQFNFPLFDN